MSFPISLMVGNLSKNSCPPFFQRAIRRAAMIFACLGTFALAGSTSHAVTLTYSNSIGGDYVDSQIEAYYHDNASALLHTLMTFNFHVPTLDGTKFSITNATFALSGFEGGVAWSSYLGFCPPCSDIGGGNLISPEVQMWLYIGHTNSGDFYADYHVSSPAACISGHAGSVRYSGLFTPGIPLTNFLSGSSLDEGGFVNFYVKARVWVSASVCHGTTNIVAWPGVMTHAGRFRLDMRYDVETISPGASAADFPPSSTANHGFQVHYEPGNQDPPPPMENLPVEVWATVAVRVTDTKVLGNDVSITWNSLGGKTNFVQVSPTLLGNFTDLSGPIVGSGTNQVSLNYVDVGGATNPPARYYRIRFVP